MKTVAVFLEIPEDSFFYLFDGDRRHLHDVFIDGYEIKEQKELQALVYDSDGKKIANQLTREEAESEVRKGAYLIRCGLIM